MLQWPEGIITFLCTDIEGSTTLNRVARIMSAGHGGQVLLSAATMQLVKFWGRTKLL